MSTVIKIIVKLLLFSLEIRYSKNNHNVSVRSKLYELNPFIDDDGIIHMYSLYDIGSRLTIGVSLTRRLFISVNGFLLVRN